MSNRKKRPARPQIVEEPIEKPIRCVKPKNAEQAKCMQIINAHTVTFLTGKVGSGKTFIAAGVAAEWLQRGLIDRIVVTRPQISSESAGFLPGSLEEKLAPFLAPLYNELGYFINVKQELERERLIIAPIAYARGVTYKNSFVLIDECQNMNFSQLRLMLTRLGDGSKLVFTGDIKQSDLFLSGKTDLEKIIDKLTPIAGIDHGVGFFNLQKSVRHPLIELICGALDK